MALSEKDMSTPYEQIMYDRREIPGMDPFLGFSITLNQVTKPGPIYSVINGILFDYPREIENGFIAATASNSQPGNNWLGFLETRTPEMLETGFAPAPPILNRILNGIQTL